MFRKRKAAPTFRDPRKERVEFEAQARGKEQEAIALRNLGRIHSIFKDHVKGLKYHEESLKIQRKLGKSIDIANGLVFLAEDLEVSGNYDKCIKTLNSAQQIFQDLGKLRKVKDINKEITRLEKFSKEVNEDEYYLSKFHLDSA